MTHGGESGSLDPSMGILLLGGGGQQQTFFVQKNLLGWNLHLNFSIFAGKLLKNNKTAQNKTWLGTSFASAPPPHAGVHNRWQPLWKSAATGINGLSCDCKSTCFLPQFWHLKVGQGITNLLFASESAYPLLWKNVTKLVQFKNISKLESLCVIDILSPNGANVSTTPTPCFLLPLPFLYLHLGNV